MDSFSSNEEINKGDRKAQTINIASRVFEKISEQKKRRKIDIHTHTRIGAHVQIPLIGAIRSCKQMDCIMIGLIVSLFFSLLFG